MTAQLGIPELPYNPLKRQRKTFSFEGTDYLVSGCPISILTLNRELEGILTKGDEEEEVIERGAAGEQVTAAVLFVQQPKKRRRYIR